MSVLNNVASNLVLASPDSPTTGYPDFRPLTANDVPALAIKQSLTTVNTANILIPYTINGVNHYVSTGFSLPAGTLKANSVIKFRLITTDSIPLGGGSLNLVVGANGNIHDPVMSSTTNSPFIWDEMFCMLSGGNAGQVIEAGTITVSGSDDQVILEYVAANTINTNAINYFGLTYNLPGSPGTNSNVNLLIVEQLN